MNATIDLLAREISTLTNNAAVAAGEFNQAAADQALMDARAHLNSMQVLFDEYFSHALMASAESKLQTSKP